MGGFQNIGKIPELKRRILISLALLAVYRIGVHIPTPGIDGRVLAGIFERAKGTLLGFFDMFAGGGLERLSVFALGIMPYISASIILQLLTVVVPTLERLSKEGEAGRRKITQYTRYGTIIISLIQGFGIAVGLEQMRGAAGELVVYNPGWSFRIMTMITLTAGTSFIMWLGEQITEKGIGNGISLIIFAGIVARMPNAIAGTMSLVSSGEMNWFVVLLIIIMMLLVVAFILFMETSQRRIPVQYAKRVVGRRMYGGQSTHLPLKVNTAGVIPPIFASSILMFPATIASFIAHPYMKKFAELLTPGSLLHEILYIGFIIFFCFFYTAIVFNPDNVADNMKKYGGYIPGIRPGKKTSEYIEKILSRITLVGALYISFVCVLPTLLVKKFNVPFYFGGTALLIVVGVALDTIQQIESHLILRHYDGLVKKSARIKGRR
ncbi:MAG TPA: preprotein translocase subunit SecY [Syntrophorhabdaceae bacterium]|nr:preprotein translocase subunit SecY [Syntrophorhabdaceae bacterium]HOL05883.1 preprotein translocase subunit SecY [Syntrophorhabdaceae bacterium]HON84652.1 preprotein translocase subunit SecY [Syntrophorhabdaceae bacterium]HOT42148.1 preprotein translocase subunit SecY [Syntrophorhabdaceae bacterium]HPC67310.1 preprotein translocase subunit SecY [Syntrophorhabdaceae bacterium]